MIQKMKSGKIVVSTNDHPHYIAGAERLARLAHEVAACKDTNGVLTVLIVTEGDSQCRMPVIFIPPPVKSREVRLSIRSTRAARK